jgi:hypothetical protein
MMTLTNESQAGRPVTVNQDAAAHGLMVQSPESTRSSNTFSADDDQQFGALEVWSVKCKAVADQAYDAPAAITNVFGGTKVARSQSYRIIGIRSTIRSLRTGGTPDHDLKVEAGDGAASEAFSDLVADVDIDGDTAGLPTERILVTAETILLTGETLRVQIGISGTTTTGTTDIDVDILAIPVKA